MSKKFLITTPEYEDTTTYCSRWSRDVIENAGQSGFKVIDLNRDEARRENFEKRMESNKPEFTMLNGHGHSAGITGQDGEEILGCDLKNESITENTVIYARSCDCGAKLGPACVENGCKAFVGYQGQFSFVYDTSRTATPERDQTAAYFFNVSNAIPNAMLKGNTVSEAINKADTQLEKEIEYLKTHYTLNAQHILPWLLWNKMVRIVHGSSDAKV